MKNILDFLRNAFSLVGSDPIYLVYIDALGTAPIGLDGFVRERYATVFPASTTPFSYSLSTLLPPAEHGFLEWSMRWHDKIIFPLPLRTSDGSSLKLGEDIEREEVFPFRSIFSDLVQEGYTVKYFTPYDDPLEHLMAGEAEVSSIKYLSEVFPLPSADLTVIYWDSLDYIQHHRYRDAAYSAELGRVRLFLKQLIDAVPKGAIVFAFGDHGHERCDRRYLLPVVGGVQPVGGGRVAFYKDVDIGDVERAISDSNIPARVFHLLDLPGFSGGYSRACVDRYGDVVVLADDHVGFKYPYEIAQGKTEWHVSSHGGLTDRERLVDVWTYRKE